MTKKHFIALADVIRPHLDPSLALDMQETYPLILDLARFCMDQNSNFNRERWLDYLADECGPNGGKKA